VHRIGRFEIAQKRLLPSWSGLLDLSDLPEVGPQAFMAALTDEQRAHFQPLNTDEERIKYQTTLQSGPSQVLVKTKEGEHGFWVIDEETGEEGFTDHTLSAVCTADHSRKESRKVMERKEKIKTRLSSAFKR